MPDDFKGTVFKKTKRNYKVAQERKNNLQVLFFSNLKKIAL
jgi:hypothetical protein